MAINLGSTAASLGSALGAGFIQPVESALDLLARKKLSDFEIGQNIKAQQAQRKLYAQGLEPIFGQQVSQFLGSLNPEERKVALQNIGGLMQLSGMQAPQQQTPQQTVMQLLAQSPAQQEPAQDSLYGKLMQLQGVPVQQGMGFNALQPQQQIQPQANVSQQPNQLIQDIFTSPAEKREREKLVLKKQQDIREQQKMQQAEKLAAFKETKKMREAILEKSKAAKEQLREYERMEELEQTGKLDTPGYVEFLERSGLSIPALTNPESEEFKKIQMQFMNGMRSVFGGKVSNLEMTNFLSAIPTLSNSPQGRKRILANLKYLAKADMAYSDAMKEIIKENKGTPPLDLGEQIDDRIGSKLDAIAKKFKKDLAKPVPPAQHRLITTTQAVAGTTIGRLPKIALGAGAGAWAGKWLGPWGAIGGGILGGLAGLGGYSIKDII